MICVVRYEVKHKPLWDDFILKSKNGVFLFYRNYMDYHADRFADHSLLFFDDNKMVAVMPANATGSEFVSHGGLTFGGIISDYRMRTPLMLEIFAALKEYLIAQGFKELIYKAIPHIYHELPAEEDLYALFIHNAKLFRRDVSSTIYMQERVSYSKGRKWSVKKSKAAGLDVRRSYDFKTFMAIEEDNLRRKYGVNPTHTADEIQLLASRFPENIKLFTVHMDDIMVAGVIVYESKNVAHAQYISSNDRGEEVGGLDIILDFLINEYYLEKKYFDFGISTEKSGRYLNVGLIQNKESFGARATVYDFYEIDLTK